MIEVQIKIDGVKIGEIEIKNAGGTLDEGDYICHYTVSRGSAIGAAVRTVYAFPRKRLNVLGLVYLALSALDKKELELERDFDPDEAPVSADLVRGLDSAREPLRAWFNRLYHYRPAIRGGQSEQHGSNRSRQKVREEDC